MALCSSSFETLPETAEQMNDGDSSSGDDNPWLNLTMINNICPNSPTASLTVIGRSESWDDEISKVFQRLLEYEDTLTLQTGGGGVIIYPSFRSSNM